MEYIISIYNVLIIKRLYLFEISFLYYKESEEKEARVFGYMFKRIFRVLVFFFIYKRAENTEF